MSLTRFKNKVLKRGRSKQTISGLGVTLSLHVVGGGEKRHATKRKVVSKLGQRDVVDVPGKQALELVQIRIQLHGS